MDDDTKRCFGKILGELYRLQRALPDGPACPVDEAAVYGLCHGFQLVIEEELERVGWISTAQIEGVGEILQEIFEDPAKTAAFKGFYDVERAFQGKGVDRAEAIRILKYFKANHQFEVLIQKMDSSDSPSECRQFELWAEER